MEKRKKIGILIIIIGLITFCVIFYFMFFPKIFEKNSANEVNESEKIIDISSKPTAIFEAKQLSDEEIEQINLERIAIDFAEIFGSYSNQSDFDNIKNAKLFMSENMKIWADDLIVKSRINKENYREYNGIITKAVSNEVAGENAILVKTQRKEMKEDGDNVFYQDILVDLIKENGEWKVDRAEWQ